MVAFSGTVKTDKARRLLSRVPNSLFAEFRKEFVRSGSQWESEMGKRLRGNPLQSRTGALARGLSSKTDGGSLNSLRLRLRASNVPHARAQELGAVITPRRAKWLWIPLGANKTPAGVPKRTPRQFFQERGSFIRTRGDSGVAFAKRGRRLVPMFALRKRVVLPGPKTTGGPSRLGFFETWDKLGPERARRHRVALARAIRTARRLS